MKKHYTIGLAGHIDHGKTTLTKALTSIDTDTLKEEKERQISIELGFAPLLQTDDLQISVIDVPGHERFVKRMIAGASGIDLFLLVVAADEGVMPQTKEHLDILRFLGVKGGIVTITKSDRVDEEFLDVVKEEIALELENTIFQDAPVFTVDSVTEKGIAELKANIIDIVQQIHPRDTKGDFRLPIDSVFSIKGQGTVARGTVHEGKIQEGSDLWILPQGIKTKARQIQVHHQSAIQAFAGQRAAINLANISMDEVERGHVLVSSLDFVVTDTLDVALNMVDELDHLVKQRMPIACYIGTSEVMGRIVFFDRNELQKAEGDILCQLRLESKVVTKRGDAFILRRPSPKETIGGGWVIDPNGQKYRFGEQTIKRLSSKKEGSSKDRVIQVLLQHTALSIDELAKHTSITKDAIGELVHSEDEFIQFSPKQVTHQRILEELQEDVFDALQSYQNRNSMRPGMPIAEVVQVFSEHYPRQLVEYVISLKEGVLWIRHKLYLSTVQFTPHVPENWEKRVRHALEKLKSDHLEVQYLSNYLEDQGIQSGLVKELTAFLVNTKKIMPLDDKYYLDYAVFQEAVRQLKANTGKTFAVADAKEVLGLSRKYMIPFLERLDDEKMTEREENIRVWR